LFKGIVACESKRLRRLNSTNEGYLEALKNLRDKCYRSNFDKVMVNDLLEKIRSKDMGQKAALEKIQHKSTENKIVWSTNIPSLYQVTPKQNNLLLQNFKIQKT